MGSERLGHLFAQKDPKFKEHCPVTKHEDHKSSSNHSLSHTSGTQPVFMSNGPRSTPSSSIIKHKINPKYKKLIKLYHRQLAHIATTLNAIESVSITDQHSNPIFSASRKRLNELNQTLENFHNSPDKHNQEAFDSLKGNIDQLIHDIQSYKSTNTSRHTIDHLVGFPLDVSDSDNEEKDKTLVYF